MNIKGGNESLNCDLIKLLQSKCNINFQAEAKILRGPHEDLESYLEAVEQLRSIVQFFTGNKAFKSGIGVVNQANNLLGKAILKLEEEFRQLLSAYRFARSQQSFTCIAL